MTPRRVALVAVTLGVLGWGLLVAPRGFAHAVEVPGSAVRRLAAAGELPVPRRAPEELRRAADDVLSRPEYRRPEPPLLERVLAWVSERIAGLVNGLSGGGDAPVVAWAVLSVALIALGLVVVRFARGVTPDAASPVSPILQRRRTAADWRQDATAHEREGRWRQALRCRYRALVADLASRGLVEEVPGRTAGEYRTAVASAVPGVASEFAGATELFEVAWYGNGPTGAEEAARIRSLSERVLKGAGS